MDIADEKRLRDPTGYVSPKLLVGGRRLTCVLQQDQDVTNTNHPSVRISVKESPVVVGHASRLIQQTLVTDLRKP